jgi:hypothetical protein
MGVLDSFIEMLVFVAPVGPEIRPESDEEPADGSGPGAPQTLQ